MALSAAYLADKSALARFPVPTVAQRLRPLLEEGLIATCAIGDLEVLFSRSTPRVGRAAGLDLIERTYRRPFPS